jgi:hypothetical protein
LTENVSFADELERELFARAKLGEQVRAFLETPVGRYLHGRARTEMQQCEVDALEALMEFDIPLWGRVIGRRKLRKIRQRSESAKNFVRWLADAIIDGDHASKELDEYTPEG